ncbi:MAG: alanine racemase [Fusobacterium sp. JB019]|nr:alanine racemase [Fusobacterium sp. JB020]MDP0507430.1 alanine racemase [Fusobacterium sp. JB019]
MAINSIKMTISKENILHNIRHLENKYKQKILPVVKANAYGHSVDLVTKILFQNHHNEFAVARLCEGLAILKDSNFKNKISILVFESIGKNNLSLIQNNPELIMSVNTLSELYETINFGISPSQISIKIDFGFGRNGILLSELKELQDFVITKDLNFKGIYSHLFSCDYEEGIEIINKFKDIITLLGKHRFEMIHLQNSAGTVHFGNLNFTTHLRVGMLTYGLQEEGFIEENLKQVFKLKGQIAGIKNVENSSYLAYNSKKNLNINSYKYIAKIKIGYGDGFLKINEGTTCLIGNKEYKISLVTMDNTFIEVDSKIKIGDPILLYPNLTLAKHETNFNIYELLTVLNSRIERILV